MAFIQHSIEEPTLANLPAGMTKAGQMLLRENDTDGKVLLFEPVDHALAIWDQTVWDLI